MSDLPYPLPSTLAHEAEALMADLPDREDTVYRLRRFLGRVYATGHQDGRLLAATEAHYDHRAPAVTATPHPRPSKDRHEGGGE